MIYGVAADVSVRREKEGRKEGTKQGRREGTKANRNSWCLNERGQLRLDIQSAEERERERRVGVDHRHSTDWMVEVAGRVAASRVVALEHAIQGDNDDDKKR